VKVGEKKPVKKQRWGAREKAEKKRTGQMTNHNDTALEERQSRRGSPKENLTNVTRPPQTTVRRGRAGGVPSGLE